jgi:hypothetical protein
MEIYVPSEYKESVGVQHEGTRMLGCAGQQMLRSNAYQQQYQQIQQNVPPF